MKKMKKEERDIAMKPTQFRVPGSNKMIDLRTLDETDETVFNTVYYKEVPLVTGDMDETVIVTYSPKYKKYQQENTQPPDRTCAKNASKHRQYPARKNAE
ncbi:MAG: hypothetical protein ACLU22_05120 [Clostridium sp.]